MLKKVKIEKKNTDPLNFGLIFQCSLIERTKAVVCNLGKPESSQLGKCQVNRGKATIGQLQSSRLNVHHIAMV